MLVRMRGTQAILSCLAVVLAAASVGACGGSSQPPPNDQTSVTVVKPGQPDPAAPAPEANPAPSK